MLQNITSCVPFTPEAETCVYINNNPYLDDISGLSTLAQCADGASSGDPFLDSISVKIVVYPPFSVGCTLCSWDSVCNYILYGADSNPCVFFETCWWVRIVNNIDRWGWIPNQARTWSQRSPLPMDEMQGVRACIIWLFKVFFSESVLMQICAMSHHAMMAIPWNVLSNRMGVTTLTN